MILFWGFVFSVVAIGLCLLFVLLVAFETRRSDVDAYNRSQRIQPLLFKLRHDLWSSALYPGIIVITYQNRPPTTRTEHERAKLKSDQTSMSAQGATSWSISQ
jgi:hypothetical protein